MRRSALRWLAALCLCVVGVCFALGAGAATLTLDVDQGEMIRLPRPANQVFVANPDIADVQAPHERTVLVLGRKPGRTTIIALDAEGLEIARHNVLVTAGLAALRERLTKDYPGLPVSVEGTPTSVIVAGNVDTPEQAHGVMELAKAYAPESQKVVNRMNLASEVQVQLRVYIAEVSRKVVQEFGANWRAVFSTTNKTAGALTGRATVDDGIPRNTTTDTLFAGAITGNWSITAVFDVLVNRGLATVLAEPSLTAISGQPATFLAGGEIPVVTRSQDGTNVTYKEYGVRLYFTPTVMSDNRINLHVRPEASQLSTVGSVSTEDGLVIPALTTRRVETTVELGSGDSFVIGGLLQKSRSMARSGIPLLSDVPLIGKLFQTETFDSDETELIVMVTPYIVQPTSPKTVNLNNRPSPTVTTLERVLTAPSKGNRPPPPGPLQGRAGFAF